MNGMQDHKWIKTTGILVHFWVLFFQNWKFITLHLFSRKQRVPFSHKPAGQSRTHTRARTHTHLLESYCSTKMNFNGHQWHQMSICIVFWQRWSHSSVHTVNSFAVHLQIIYSVPQTNRQSTFTTTDKVHNHTHKHISRSTQTAASETMGIDTERHRKGRETLIQLGDRWGETERREERGRGGGRRERDRFVSKTGNKVVITSLWVCWL